MPSIRFVILPHIDPVNWKKNPNHQAAQLIKTN